MELIILSWSLREASIAPHSHIAATRIYQWLPPSLQYACQYWVHHAKQSNADLHDGCQTHVFLKKHFFALARGHEPSGHHRQRYYACEDVTVACLSRWPNSFWKWGLNANFQMQKQGSVELQVLLEDAQRFILTDRYITNLAPLQLYSSALIFTPQRSAIRNLNSRVPQWLCELLTTTTWGPELQKLEGHIGVVSKVVFS